MEKEKIWFSIVGLKPFDGNEIAPKANAIYVNVALVAKNKTTFKKILKENFLYHKFEVFEILDIETEDSMTVDDPSTSEKIKLLEEINGGYKFAWGTFFYTKKK